MKLIEYSDKDTLMVELAQVLEASLARALAEKETVTFAVPGGTTPGPLFDALSAAPLAWERVHVILTDERWVPQDDAQSNAALIKKRLLTGAAAAAQFTPYYSATSEIAQAATALSVELEPLLPIDVLLLGMGADMHTASLFPGAAGLDAALSQDAPMFLPVSVPGHTVQRFSLTSPALSSARDTHVLITGPQKRKALEQAGTLPPEQAPIGLMLDTATIHWSAE